MPLPDGVNVEDIPGNRPEDHDLSDAWNEIQDEFDHRWSWLIHHLEHKGFLGLAKQMEEAEDHRSYRKIAKEVSLVCFENDLHAAHQELEDLRVLMPGVDL